MKFTEQEDKFLRDNYLTIPTKRISKMLGRSESSARQRMQLLGVVVPPEIREKFKRDSQIKPGNISFNKGKKQSDYMSPEAIEAGKSTQFKKGHIPHNACENNGEIRPRFDKDTGIEYLYIRISLGKWVPLHSHNWEQINGKIPEGHCLWCLGETSNCDPSNWELINRAENYRRNSSYNTLKDGYVANCLAWRDPELKAEILKHPELIELKRNQLLLNREINGKG